MTKDPQPRPGDENTQVYRDASLTFGGKPFVGESVTVVRANRVRPDDDEELPRSLSYSATCECEMPISVFEDLQRALAPRLPAGAHPLTLARRVTYGGRKGRRALQRLRAMGYNVVAWLERDMPGGRIALPVTRGPAL